MSQANNVKALPTIHANPHLAKSYRVSGSFDDANFKEVAPQVKKKVTVVYNHFNLEAVLAAAILKGCYPEFSILTAAQVFDRDSDLYVWIGVKSEDLVSRSMMKGAEHMQYSSYDPQPIDENGWRPNLIDRVCEDFKVRQTHPIAKLSYQASRFYHPNMALDELTEVYNELLNAVDILSDRENLREHDITEADYIQAVTEVKKQMNRSYRRIPMKDGEKTKEVFYTNFADYQFILALRIIKLSHTDYANHITSLGNNLIYSSLYDPVMGEEVQNVVVLN